MTWRFDWRPRWPFPRRRYNEARQGLERAERELERVRRQWPLVHEAVGLLKAHTERNHFSESIAHIYRGDK